MLSQVPRGNVTVPTFNPEDGPGRASPSTKRPATDGTPTPFTGVFRHSPEAPSHQFPCLVTWGSLCIFTFVCFASAVPRPYLGSQVKMPWDTKLPEASFPSVLILLHTAPWLCSPPQFLPVFIDHQVGLLQPEAWHPLSRQYGSPEA